MSVGSVIEVKPSSVEAPPTLVVVPSPEKPKRSRICRGDSGGYFFSCSYTTGSRTWLPCGAIWPS